MVPFAQRKVELVIDGALLGELPTHGTIVISDLGFEFHDERNPLRDIKVAWGELAYVEAQLEKHSVTRFALIVEGGGYVAFSTPDNKAVLRAIHPHIPESHLLRAPGFIGVIGLGIARELLP